MKTIKLGRRDYMDKLLHFEDTVNGTVLHHQTVMRPHDLQRILDTNHERRRDGQNPTAQVRHIGTVPYTLLMQWEQKYNREGMDRDFESFGAYVEKMLKDHDFSLLRTGKA